MSWSRRGVNVILIFLFCLFTARPNEPPFNSLHLVESKKGGKRGARVFILSKGYSIRHLVRGFVHVSLS